MFMGDYKVMVFLIVKEVGIFEFVMGFKRVMDVSVVVLIFQFVMMVMEFDVFLEKEVDEFDEFLFVIVWCMFVMKVCMIDVFYWQNNFVVMMGDGVNDVFSLKKVDVGIVMGVGSDVVKMLSDIVFMDNNFVMIVYVVVEG